MADTHKKNSATDSPTLGEAAPSPLIVEKPAVGSIDHLAISKSLGYQIFRKNRRNAWSAEEDECLKSLIIKQYIKTSKLEKYNNEPIDIKSIDWVDISNNMITKRRGKECKKRWVSSLDPFLRKGKWTAEEDQALIKAFKIHGPAWQKVANDIEGRNEDQCSKRYTEVLNSDTRERLKPWTLEEDLILIKQVKEYGTKWRQISQALPTRPSLTCRNRWRKIMTDIAKDSASDTIKKAVGVLDENGKPIVQFKESELAKVSKKDKKDTKAGKEKKRSISDKDLSPAESMASDNTDLSDKPANKRQKAGGIDNTPTPPSITPTFTKTTTMYPRVATPSRTQTDWSFSLLDPRTKEEMKSYSGNIKTQELAHYLIDLARFNGVTLTVHQHIHHHYSSTPAGVNTDPQANLSRYGHFNYLPPLTEVPKLTSSSSPDNTVDSNNSNKNYNENSLFRLLNSEERAKANNNSSVHEKPPTFNGESRSNSQNMSEENSKPHRQQFYPSNVTLAGANLNTNQVNSNFPHSAHQINPSTSNNDSNNNSGSSRNNNKNNDSRSKSGKKTYVTEDIDEELDFWETMRSMNNPRNTKPVSQHHPLHYYQPSNYKEQSPYQPSDSFGIQRFPNMATPFTTNANENQKQTTSVAPSNQNFGLYVGAEEDEEEDEDEEGEQYGMYYSVFANRTHVNEGEYSRHGEVNSSNGGATGLVNSGYLMPFNPS